MAIKWISGMNENPANGLTRSEAQRYWAESHGTLNANIGYNIHRYYHYFTLPEAYEAEPKPTFMGITMLWPRDPAHPWSWSATDPIPPEVHPTRPDDRWLFDRSDRWPVHRQASHIMAEEHVLIDGEKRPGMVNAIFMVSRLPGMNHQNFFRHWSEVHAPLAAKVPGLRRYIQNHVDLDSVKDGRQTHDGWSELWFDDFASFQRAVASPEWRTMEEDGRTLFAPEKGIVIGPEYIQRDESWKAPRDFGALSMTEAEIRERLQREGYGDLLRADPQAPAKIKAAAEKGKLGVWTDGHLVTVDESRIDVRPSRAAQA